MTDPNDSSDPTEGFPEGDSPKRPPSDASRPTERGDSSAPMAPAASADRNLLFGIVALQMSFVTREALIQAMNQWLLNKVARIEDILLANGDMDAEARQLLAAVVEKHLRQHGGQTEQSLAALNPSSADDLKSALTLLEDPDLIRSIGHVGDSPPGNSPRATLAWGNRSDDGRRFQILRPHRSGGLGSVSVALDRELNREVAIKEVRSELSVNPRTHERLRIEAEITGRLEHPGIVPVYGLGSYADGKPFYCMRFIRGDSLKDAIATFHENKHAWDSAHRNLELRGLLRRFIDVCDAVAYAHSRQVLHRDLKPGNIMLGKYGETLVVDWGLAKATGTSGRKPETTELPIVPRSGSTAAPTQAGAKIGTPEYMSPEQAEGRIEELGPATDVYSLGATLYCLLTGKPPFGEKTTAKTLERVCAGDFPPPTAVDSSIPKPLEAICLRAMQTQPQERYADASKVALDVERWLADEQVSVYREPILNRLARAARKNRTTTASLAVGTAVALLGLIVINVVTWSKNREIAAKSDQIAEQNTQLAASNAALTESQRRLSENFRTFRSLTAAMIQKSERELSQDPKMESARDWLASEALDIYTKFREQNPNQALTDSSASNVWLAQLYRYSANNQRLRGETQAAIDGYQIAESIYVDLYAANPEDPRTIGFMSETLRDYGSTQGVAGNISAALELQRRAVNLSQALRDRYPEAINSRKLHAANLAELASVLLETNSIDEALQAATQSAELFETLVASGNVNVTDQQMYVFALVEQAKCHRNAGSVIDARPPLQRAQELLAARSEETELLGNQHTYARTLLELHAVESQLDPSNPQLATWIDETIEIWGKLSEDFPHIPHYQRYAAAAHVAKAKAFAMQGQQTEAEQMMQVAVSLTEELSQRIENFRHFEAHGDALLAQADIVATSNDTDLVKDLLNRALEQYSRAQELSSGYELLAGKLAMLESRAAQVEE